MVVPAPPDPAPDPAEADIFAPDFAPVPLLRRRRNGWTPERQRMFIALLVETGSVSLAARCVGLSARSAYDLREKPGAEEFDDAWEEAIEIGRQQVREKLMDRWRYGQLVPVRRRGRIVRHERRYNDAPLVAVLASHRRETPDGDWRARALRDSRHEAVQDAREQAARERQAEAERRSAAAETARRIAENTKPAKPRIRRL